MFLLSAQSTESLGKLRAAVRKSGPGGLSDLETLSSNSTCADVLRFRIYKANTSYPLWIFLLNCTPFIGKSPCLPHHLYPSFTPLPSKLRWFLFTTQLERKWEMFYLTQKWSNMLKYLTWVIRTVFHQKEAYSIVIRNLYKLFVIPTDHYFLNEHHLKLGHASLRILRKELGSNLREWNSVPWTIPVWTYNSNLRWIWRSLGKAWRYAPSGNSANHKIWELVVSLEII